MADALCPTCSHQQSLGRCWRMTCPTNGARESFHVVLPRPLYQKAKQASVERGRRIIRGEYDQTPRDEEFMF